MERLTDRTEDGLICLNNNGDCRFIGQLIKAMEKLAEFEDFMDEYGFESLGTFRAAINLNQLMNKAGIEHFKENQALKDRWEKLKKFVNTPKEIQQWDERFEVTVDSIKAKMKELEEK